MKYCQDNNLEPNEVNVYLAPFMSIAGDHAHNDLWGIEAIAENKGLDKVELNTNEYSWRERLEKAGFKVDRTFEAHPVGKPMPITVSKTAAVSRLWAAIPKSAQSG